MNSNLKPASGQPAPLAEIPDQLQRLSCDTIDLRSLLASLHELLGPVMPPAYPEAESALSAVEQTPQSELGQQIAEQSRLVRQASASVRNLLDRIKL